MAVVVLNWKNALDTIDCIRSIVASVHSEPIYLVVCDNNSDDGSDVKILAELNSHCRSVRKWICQSRTGRLTEYEIENPVVSDCPEVYGEFLLIDRNMGFAGGNNLGLKWVLNHTDSDSILILNNDAIVEPNTLREGTSYLRKNSKYGIAGCVVRYFHNPEHVQAYGGAEFFPSLGRAKHLCADMRFDLLPAADEVLETISYPLGAAIFVSRAFLVDVGLMYENYFLYFEEIDWAHRGKIKGYQVGVVSGATVFHKEGGTIGSSHIKSKRSHVSEHYLNRARLMFARRWFPIYVPTVLSYNIFLALRALLHGEATRAKIIVTATWQGLMESLS